MDEFLQSFTATTIDVLRKSGFEEYLPTLVVPSQSVVTLIEGIPAGVQHTKALVDTIIERGLSDEELLFGVKVGRNVVVTGHYVPGAKCQFTEITMAGGEFRERVGVECDWWTVSSSKRPS